MCGFGASGSPLAFAWTRSRVSSAGTASAVTKAPTRIQSKDLDEEVRSSVAIGSEPEIDEWIVRAACDLQQRQRKEHAEAGGSGSIGGEAEGRQAQELEPTVQRRPS